MRLSQQLVSDPFDLALCKSFCVQCSAYWCIGRLLQLYRQIHHSKGIGRPILNSDSAKRHTRAIDHRVGYRMHKNVGKNCSKGTLPCPDKWSTPTPTPCQLGSRQPLTMTIAMTNLPQACYKNVSWRLRALITSTTSAFPFHQHHHVQRQDLVQCVYTNPAASAE